MLENVKNLLSDGVTALGGILIVFGLVNLGLTIKDGMQGGGGQLSGALAMIIGGAIVVGAAIYFGQLNTMALECILAFIIGMQHRIDSPEEVMTQAFQ